MKDAKGDPPDPAVAVTGDSLMRIGCCDTDPKVAIRKLRDPVLAPGDIRSFELPSDSR